MRTEMSQFSRLSSSYIQIVIDLLVPLPILCENKYKPFIDLDENYYLKMLNIDYHSLISMKLNLHIVLCHPIRKGNDRSYHFDAKMIKLNLCASNPMRIFPIKILKQA